MKRSRRARMTAAVLALGSLAAVGCGDPVPTAGLVLVTIDTCRADRIGAYGAVDASTPNIDGLAEVSVKYTRAVSQSPWTTPSVG